MQSVFSPGAYDVHRNRRTATRTDIGAGIAVAVAMHIAVIFLLLRYEPARTALTHAVPLMVSLITPETPKPEVVLPTPLPVKQISQKPRIGPPQPVLAAAPEAPSTVSVPPAPPAAPPAPIESAPPPTAALPAVQTVAPAPVVPPVFNANYLNNPAPAYPALPRRQGHQGKVVLRVFVSSAGAADQVQIRNSSGYDLLDQAALNAVRRWRFVPARQGDQPIAAWVLVPITFTLEG
jgi:protein TonB